jgi:hypothetical protein
VTGLVLDGSFPALTVHERALFRIHRAPNGPLSFCDSGVGQFDLLDVERAGGSTSEVAGSGRWAPLCRGSG